VGSGGDAAVSMDRETAIAFLVDHYKHPRHKGRLAEPDVEMPGGNPGCGDVVVVQVRVDPTGGRIVEAAFEGSGCTISQAAASILLQRVNREQPQLDSVLELSYDEMIDMLGRDVVGFRHRCATLALGTLKAAVKTIQTDAKLRAAGYSDDEIRELRAARAAQAAGPGLVVGDGAAAAAHSQRSAKEE
jgi:nitrogen fixation NifU-like protein